MGQGIIKHVFPGGNTTKGFYSFYDNILFQDEATRIIVIKGGPGVGKSSFMKKIGERMLDAGYDLEYHHCSSDNNSLDGIVIPSIKVALLDGTAPHVVDPINPGAVDEILHLGDFWNEEALRKNKEDILRTNQEVGRLFRKAYHYLAASSDVYDSWAASQSKAFDMSKASVKTNDLLSALFANVKVSDTLGKERHLFGTAITPEGFSDYLHTIIGMSKSVYIVKDAPGAPCGVLMERVRQAAVERGLYVECYHSPIRVDKIEDVIIPELELALTAVNDYHKAKVLPTHIVDLTACLDQNILKSHQGEIELDKKIFDDLVGRAISLIQRAKKTHDEMERYYVPNMYFDQIDIVFEKVMDRIMKYSEEFK